MEGWEKITVAYLGIMGTKEYDAYNVLTSAFYPFCWKRNKR
jgi:hypothetical protein